MNLRGTYTSPWCLWLLCYLQPLISKGALAACLICILKSNHNADRDNGTVDNPCNRWRHGFHVHTRHKKVCRRHVHECVISAHHSDAFKSKDGRPKEERVVFSSANFWEVNGVFDVLWGERKMAGYTPNHILSTVKRSSLQTTGQQHPLCPFTG